MQFERVKPPETPNAPYREAHIREERWRLAGPGSEHGRAGPWLSSTSFQSELKKYRTEEWVSPPLQRQSI
jgi:hypothetical protein